MVFEKPRDHSISDLTTISPRISEETTKNLNEYTKLIEGLKTYFLFMRLCVSDALSPLEACLHDSQMEKYDPKTHNKLAEYVSEVPHKGESPFFPFAACASNCNADVLPHRDIKDGHQTCTTASFGDFTGGELVLYELRLIIKTRPLELIQFPSALINHFTLDYEGRRGSFVFHSDRELIRWYIERNGWENMVMGKSNGKVRDVKDKIIVTDFNGDKHVHDALVP